LRGSYCLHGGRKHLWNVGKVLPDFPKQQSRKQSFSRNENFTLLQNTPIQHGFVASFVFSTWRDKRNFANLITLQISYRAVRLSWSRGITWQNTTTLRTSNLNTTHFTKIKIASACFFLEIRLIWTHLKQTLQVSILSAFVLRASFSVNYFNSQFRGLP
jgi:hypothetical protein